MTNIANEHCQRSSTRTTKDCYADSEQPCLDQILDSLDCILKSLDCIFTEIKDDLSFYTTWDEKQLSKPVQDEICTSIRRHSTEK